MTPALVMIPRITGSASRDKYLMLCMKYVTDAGYFPIEKRAYENYMQMKPTKFLELMFQMCSAVYVFTDFGIDIQMAKSIEKSVKVGIVVNYINLDPFADDIALKIAEVLEEVAGKTDVSIKKLKSKTRKRDIVDARFIFYRRAREVFGSRMSYQRIGDETGGKDHATVMNGIKRANEVRQLRDQYNRYFGSNN